MIGYRVKKKLLNVKIDTFLLKLKAANEQNEKRQKQFDRLIDEWKQKVSDQQTQLESVQKEARANAAEAYKYKSQLEETGGVIDGLRREIKNLSGIKISRHNNS